MSVADYEIGGIDGAIICKRKDGAVTWKGQTKGPNFLCRNLFHFETRRMASGCLGARSAKGHKILTFVDPQTPFFEKNRFERDIADNVVKQVDWTQEFYPCTLSSRTIVYKGMLTPEQVWLENICVYGCIQFLYLMPKWQHYKKNKVKDNFKRNAYGTLGM